MIKLFYKSYNYKMSLGAMRDYRQAANRCLWHDLLAVLEAWEASLVDIDTVNSTNTHIVAHRMRSICNAVPYNDALHLFKSLIDAGGDKVSLDEIDDAMFRAGMMPSDRPDDCGEPWTFVLIKTAKEINLSMLPDNDDDGEVKKKPEAIIEAEDQDL